MKQQFFMLFTTGALCAALTGAAFAGSSASSQDETQVVSQLEQRSQKLEQEAQTTKGAGQALMEMQARGMNHDAEKIQAGEPVNPQEVDRLLSEGPQ
jgi:TolA-binding protein